MGVGVAAAAGNGGGSGADEGRGRRGNGAAAARQLEVGALYSFRLVFYPICFSLYMYVSIVLNGQQTRAFVSRFECGRSCGLFTSLPGSVFVPDPPLSTTGLGI